MGDLRTSLLRQQLQRELAKARALEKAGKVKEAGVCYIKAGAIYRRLAYTAPKSRAEEMFHTASQYESLGNTIKRGKAVAEMRAVSPEVYEGAIDSLIVSTKPDTSWEHIGGLSDVKRTIKEAIILPFIQDKPPYIRSTRTILLYGPPGTGKTLLAKASSNTLNATFFEARLSTLLSKYFGESSKLVNSLFTKARKLQPSVIFMDELDSVAGIRGAGMHEATRRVLGQILTEIEGFNTKKEDKVLIMGATNKPWDLDEAMISRFERKIYVPLPDEKARKAIFRIHLEGAELGFDLSELVSRTPGFSGRDIAHVCQEAINLMVRESNPNLTELTPQQLEKYSLKSRALTLDDFEIALKTIKPATKPAELKKYEEWRRDFGG